LPKLAYNTGAELLGSLISAPDLKIKLANQVLIYGIISQPIKTGVQGGKNAKAHLLKPIDSPAKRSSLSPVFEVPMPPRNGQRRKEDSRLKRGTKKAINPVLKID
jgi:hypothetical protein